MIKKVKIYIILLMNLMEKKLWEHSTKSSCKTQIKKNLEFTKYSREMAINYMLNGKDTIIHLMG